MTRSGGTARSLAQLVPKLARAVMGKRGFAEAGLLADWQAVVGEDIAAKALPERLDFPRGERRDGTLHLSVGGAWALALQHLEPQLVERINSYFGYRAVGRLKLHQVALPPRRQVPEPSRAGSPQDADASGAQGKDAADDVPPRTAAAEGEARALAAIEHPALRAALLRLSRAWPQRGSPGKKSAG
jgi:hypothetical protein